MQTIPYNRIPNQPPIFLDAVDAFGKVSDYFNGDFRDPDSFKRVWQDTQSFPFKRKALADVLSKELARLEAPEASRENAKVIAEPESATVLTGQQIGVIGGPIYTVIKAVAAIRWAERLSDTLDIPVVPIFWMEGEDHDFEEIRRVSVMDRDGNRVSVELEDRRPDPLHVIGWHRPESEMEAFLKQLDDVLPAGMHRDVVMDRVRSCYRPGNSLSDAFARWLLSWLGDRGLVVVESLNPDLKRLAAPYFQRAVRDADKHAELFYKRAKELHATGYPCTLTPSHAFHFFYRLEEGVRKPVPRDPGRAGGVPQKDLLRLAKNHSERMSPKAVLRPVIQDVLFPTIAIVAGPGEVSYFPQVHPLYRDFERPMPVIVPRPGVTLMEKSWLRNVDKLSLSVEDFFLTQDSLSRKMAAAQHGDALAGLDEKIRRVEKDLRHLESEAESSIPARSRKAERLRQEIGSRLQHFRNRIQSDIAAGDEETASKIQRLRTAVFPEGKLQERAYSPLNFLIRHGFQWMADRLASVPVDAYQHVVLPVEE